METWSKINFTLVNVIYLIFEIFDRFINPSKERFINFFNVYCELSPKITKQLCVGTVKLVRI